jgi:hypothetical protein
MKGDQFSEVGRFFYRSLHYSLVARITKNASFGKLALENIERAVDLGRKLSGLDSKILDNLRVQTVAVQTNWRTGSFVDEFDLDEEFAFCEHRDVDHFFSDWVTNTFCKYFWGDFPLPFVLAFQPNIESNFNLGKIQAELEVRNELYKMSIEGGIEINWHEPWHPSANNLIYELYGILLEAAKYLCWSPRFYHSESHLRTRIPPSIHSRTSYTARRVCFSS